VTHWREARDGMIYVRNERGEWEWIDPRRPRRRLLWSVVAGVLLLASCVWEALRW